VESSNSSNKRIAKNTLLLYFRMLLTMAVSLYTVRVILDTLGVVDYGLYNVVGGVVLMFSFLSSTMSSASQRFFSFELGKKNYEKLKQTFSMTMTIYILIAVIILILAETVGLWFLNTKMTIPVNRMEAANWVYQFSILAFMMTMFTIPYNAILIAREHMSVYAYVSIVEIILKLLIVYLLLAFTMDKLILYSILTFGVTTLVTLIYRVYCIKRFAECKYSFYWDRELFRSITNYSGWNLFGALATIINNYGTNIVLNLFFGPVVNSARGIAYRINSIVSQFVLSFMTATRPQIVKHYASGEYEKMNSLVFKSSKFSYLLLFVLSMPVIVEAPFILSIWLKTVPAYTVLFARLTIISALLDSISYPLIAAALATGKIKLYQIVVGGVLLLSVPISYVFMKFGFPPQTPMIIAIIVSTVVLFLRLIMLRKLIHFPVLSFVKKTMLPILLVTILSCLLIYFVKVNLDKINPTLAFFSICASCVVIVTIISYFLGFSSDDRVFFKSILANKMNKKVLNKKNI